MTSTRHHAEPLPPPEPQPPTPPHGPDGPLHPPPAGGGDPSRTGAVWVAGTGALLLLAAAAVFVAVRWDQIPASAKLGAIAALTGAFLLAGRRLRQPLPATAGALYHLGAFLVPVDVAALAVRAELGWRELLLVEGLACTVTFTVAARAERSRVLWWAAVAAVVLAAAGVGATTTVPAPAVLVAASAVALAAGRPGEAVPWAVVAGLGPVAGLVLTGTGLAPGVLEQLGLAGGQAGLGGLLTGAAAAAVLGAVARDRLDPALAHLAIACVTSGAAMSGVEHDLGAASWVVGCCALLAVLEAGALLARHDPFWSRPSDQLATVAEVLAVPGTVTAAGALLLAPVVALHSPHGAVATGLLTATWLMADLRRRAGRGTPVSLALLLGGRLSSATMGVAACAPAAVLLSTGSGPAGAVALTATAALLLVGGRPLAAGTAAAMTALAPLAALGRPERSVRSSWLVDGSSSWLRVDTTTLVLACLAVVGLGGSMLLGCAVRWRTDLATSQRRPVEPGTWLLALWSLAPLAVAGAGAASVAWPRDAVLVGSVGLAWLVALAADRRGGATGGPATLPLDPAVAVHLVGAALVVGACGTVGTGAALAAAALVSTLAVLDAWRLDTPAVALGLAGSLPVLATATGLVAGLSTPRVGVGVAAGAVVVAAITSLLSRRWWLPVGASSATLATLGLALAAGDEVALADALLVVGGALAIAGLAARRPDVAVAGGVGLTLGAWGRLADADVSISEPYLVPVAALLLLAGWGGRRTASSWVTTGPAIALLGGAGLAERLAGGSGGHALVVGAVGVAAVAAGGTWRLAAPLVLGSGLLAALAVHESLGVTASVPTWAWLALGGATLLGAGVLLERAQLGPLESGRRLVDVVQERFR